MSDAAAWEASVTRKPPRFAFLLVSYYARCGARKTGFTLL